MEAIVSGKLGTAALIENGRAEVIWMSGRTEHMSVSSAQNLYRNVDDAILLESCSRNSALDSLNLHWMKDRALLLCLAFLDIETPTDERSQIEVHLEKLLAEDRVAEYVKSVLYSQPLPLEEVLPPNDLISDTYLGQFLATIFEHQPSINQVREAWTSASCDLPTELREQFEKRLVGLGAFFRLTSRSKSEVSSLKFDCLEKLSDLPDFRSVVSAFIDPHLELCEIIEPASQQTELEYHPDANTQASRSYNSKTSHEKFEHVTSQLKIAASLFKSGEVNEAEKVIAWVTEEQIAAGDNEHAAMTLCSASELAKQSLNYGLQVAYAHRATKIAPLDSRSLGHLADAYYNTGEYRSAISFFEKSVKCGNDSSDIVYGLTGQARVLRKLHQPHDAFPLVQEALEHTDVDLPAWDLKAEILRDLGQYDEAIEAYDIASRKFPASSVPICGKAAACADAGYYKLALETYQQSIDFFPNHSVAYTGKGHLLARMGDLKNALPLLHKGIELAEDKHIALSALASAYRINGKYGRAIKILCDELQASIPTAVLFSQLIETAIQSGKYTEAARWLSEAIDTLGPSPSFAIQHAKLLSAQGQFQEALDYLETEIKLPSFRIEVATEKSCLLRRLSQFEKASLELEPFLNGIVTNPYLRAEATLLGLMPIPEKVVEDRAGNKDLVTVEDWEQDYAASVALIRLNKARDAWRITLDGKKRAPFRYVRRKFALLLAIARNALNRSGSVTNALKGSPTDASFIVKVIAYWKLDLKDQLNSVLTDARNQIKPKSPVFPYLDSVAQLVSVPSLSEAANDQAHDIESSLLLQIA